MSWCNRLQVLPTRLNLSIWFPTTQVPHCLHHTTEQITETLSHILNGCHAYKGMYIARHDRIVELIAKDISKFHASSVRMYKHSCVIPSMFHLCDNPDIFTSQLTHQMLLLMKSREVSVDIACTFDPKPRGSFYDQGHYMPATSAYYLSNRVDYYQ